MEPPSEQFAREDSLQRLTGSPAPAQALDELEPKKPAPSAAALGRSGTLSWQRRPQSGTGSIRRPLSAVSVASDKVAASSLRDSPEPSSPAAPALSRNQIAQSLGAKDPSWFKQTPDRGIGSAAFRRNQDDSVSEAGSVSGRRQLPGMSRESTAEPEATSPPPDSIRSSSPSHTSSVRGSAAFSNRFSTNTSVSGGDAEPVGKIRSPLPVLDSQRFAPPSETSSADGGDQTAAARGLAMSPTQGRISPERADRPASPTKGMGGFVQSAMLKRSDSVNKRWSTQTPQGLSRQNSTLSNRGGTPSSGFGSLSKAEIATPKDEFVKPALPHHSRSKSVASTFSEKDAPQDETSPPSPSKRWSPTKSSWLESALKKPESPKLTQQPPAQPAWMSEINRIKQQRGSVDLGKNSSPFQSPSTEKPASGRTSPIKDIQLKPVGLRRTETPKREEPKKQEFERDVPKKEESIRKEPKKEDVSEPIKPSPKPKPALSPKPPVSTEMQDQVLDDPEPDIEKSEGKKPEAAATDASIKATSFRSSKDTTLSSPALKPKPETPPKKDFRANLRSRQGTSEASKSSEVSELQNVFGRLKKAETKNYKAPDVLKDNILRGKAGLALTGGPKPSVRRDEFKDSLVTQKAAMLAKAQETGSAAHKKTDSSSKPVSPPEALAKRQALGRSDSITKVPVEKQIEKEPAPEAIARKQSLRNSKPIMAEKQTPPAPIFASKEPAKSSKLANRFNPALAGILARGPPGPSSSSTSDGAPSEPTARPAEEEKKGPAPELTHMTKGRARGPKRRAPAAKQNETAKEATPFKVAPIAAVPLVIPENVLPSSENNQTDKAPEDSPVSRTPTRDSLKAKPITPAKSPDLTRKLDKSPSPELPRKPPSLDMDRKASLEVKETLKKPAQVQPIQSPKPSLPSPKTSNFQTLRPLPTPPAKPESQREPPAVLKEIAAPNVEISPVKETSSPDKSGFSVKSATALWGRQSASTSPAPARTKSPIKLPTRADEKAAMEDAGLAARDEPAPVEQPKPLAPKPKPLGLGLGSLGGTLGGLGNLVAGRAKSRESSPQPPLSAKAPSFPVSPPASGGFRPQSEPFKASPMPEKSDGLFAEYFDEPPITDGELPANIDTIQILKSPPIDLGPSSKIRTLRKQIQEITGDGKLISIPMQEEHVLYQDSMYVCTHVFGDSKGARHTEVYLWSGNGVADATLEDVQLFGRNIAKQNQGKLITIRQGKETPTFFEALGGIVITRRGSRPSVNEYMLCGRRHLGHIAFDEVDFSPKSFCSGFAYLIATSSGKVFLWKGRGCSAEELSAARLMGMDINSSGELIEIDEGSETPDLLSAFPASTSSVGKQPAIPRSADHWRYKATSDKYRARLFRVEQHSGAASGWGLGMGQGLQVSSFFAPLAALRRPSWGSSSQNAERPQTPGTPKSPIPPQSSGSGSATATTKVVEIMPFCQRDLEPESVYVLDAIIPPLSRTQSAAFSTALLFAQDYGLLAVSAEDRPFMPVATVVLEGVPRDMKAVFRHWDDARIPAEGLMAGRLGRGKSLRILGLEKAIEGTRRGR
ncbi:hypothetical protein K491DRAFT_603610 [Lophiostoma macrostomum CBS 122681]|uniref:DUF4045 domain-containing protein n=1 Tax=Lophiostoma macrostomum CBS 122681 TaxID=1314788 RepID=A0A6A6T2E3_9PLEO|nr:hypothetical protein K491DRAFT_603610 [Lophiostoma macrostomum CBS 122681]